MKIAETSISKYKYQFNGKKGRVAKFGHNGVMPIADIDGFENIENISEASDELCLVSVIVKVGYSPYEVGMFFCADPESELAIQKAKEIKKEWCKK